MVRSIFCLSARGGRLVTCLVALATCPLAALSQSPPRAPKPDPLNPMATVPALTYASSLKLEPRVASESPISWREANDTVARIGGWRVYAREASQPAPESRPTPAPAAAQAPAPAASAVMPAPAAAPHAHGGQHKP